VLTFWLQCKKQKSKSINGIWQSIGYGRILKIDSGEYSYFDITKISCLPIKQGAITDFEKAINIVNDTLSIKKGFTHYSFIRVKELPSLCQEKIQHPDDALYNFEVFSTTYKEHYEYFKLNNVNWDSLYSISKNKISSTTTDAELYLVLKEMLDVLNDNHGSIEPPDDVVELAEKLVKETATNEQLKEFGDFEIAGLVEEHYLPENLTADSRIVKWGKMQGNIGYIQVNAMMLFADLNLSESLVERNGFVQTYFEAYETLSEVKQGELEVAGIRAIMDRVMNDLAETQFIILDVRFNGGGIDEVGLEILSRFNPKRQVIARKKARHNNGYTKNIEIYLAAAEKPFTKPVYILTSQQSASATDMLALSSIELTHAKRIGSHSQGALSDALQKKLPNGWYFSLSNEVYTDNRGVCYESVGIPVDYELHYHEDRQTFFRYVAANLEQDRQNILNAIKELDN
jgi:carboxyl-terminal processing protease